MFVESRARSAAKAVSWRLLGSLGTAAIVFIFTRRAVLSLGVGVLEGLFKSFFYFGHERLWNRIRFGRREMRPAVLWFTGLPGSGKSALARQVCEALKGRGLRAEHLDGDGVRRVFPETGFSRAERDAHIRRAGHLASALEKNGIFVAASFISPYADSREFVRRLCGRFIEIYVSTPLDVCEERDAKGLYAKARRGQIRDFTGISAPYEAPAHPELTIDASGLSPEQAAARVVEYLDQTSPGGAG